MKDKVVITKKHIFKYYLKRIYNRILLGGDETMPIKTLEINSKALHLMKAVTNADYNAKTVLTNSAWEYVELWLKRHKTERGERALFYWKQAYNFLMHRSVFL